MITKIKNTLTFSLLLIVHFSFGQWSQMPNYPGGAIVSESFSIGSKAYLISGTDNVLFYNSVYEYDMLNNTWSQKANFPGNARVGAVAFSVNNKGYFGLGQSSTGALSDIWEYDPVNDSWIQKTIFPGGNRVEAIGFNIGNKAYVGTGFKNVNLATTIIYDDFWEYDPTTNMWTAKASIPTSAATPGRADAVGISLNNMGYVGLGNDKATADYDDFYEYNPQNDTWLIKDAIPGGGHSGSGIFTLNNEIYVIGGANYTSGFGYSSVSKFNPTSGAWSNLSNFPNGIIVNPVAIGYTNTAFVGTGADDSLSPQDIWWKYQSIPTDVNKNEMQAIEMISYPNPVKDVLKLQFKELSSKLNCTIKLLSLDGKVLYEESITADKINHEIDMTAFSNGMYIIEFFSNERIYTNKIIKE